MKNAKVYLAARSPEKGAAAIKTLEEETQKKAIFLQLDLADLKSVRAAAETYLAQEERLDILFNSGCVSIVSDTGTGTEIPFGSGVMISPPEQLTAQNHDLRERWVL